jgi:hypothetical protein
VYANHIPSIPPATLPSNEVRENESAPSSEGIYPPAKEPTIIPSIIIDFRDMVVTKINVYSCIPAQFEIFIYPILITFLSGAERNSSDR